MRFDQIWCSASLFGVAINPDVQHKPDEGKHVLAARVQGNGEAIVIADADLMSEQFFDLRRHGDREPELR